MVILVIVVMSLGLLLIGCVKAYTTAGNEANDTVTNNEVVTDLDTRASIESFLGGFVDYPLIPSFNQNNYADLMEWIGYEVLSRQEGFDIECLFGKNEISASDYHSFLVNTISFGESISYSQENLVIEGRLPASSAKIVIDSVSMDKDGKYHVTGHNQDREEIERQWKEFNSDPDDPCYSECVIMIDFSAVLVKENDTWKLEEWNNIDVQQVIR